MASRKTILTIALFGTLFFGPAVCCLHAQSEASQEIIEQQHQLRWKLINTAIFAVLLGYYIAKSAPRFFNARSADIQRAIKDATGLKMDADLRYSEADRKMATLAEAISRLRAEAAAEMEREHQRVRHETEQERDRIDHNVAAEIEAFRLAGIRQVRRRTATAALDLAEQQLRERAPGHEGDFLHDFVNIVEGGK
jgi:F0F1-type ATP synthase membrane subunit b/b'